MKKRTFLILGIFSTLQAVASCPDYEIRSLYEQHFCRMPVDFEINHSKKLSSCAEVSSQLVTIYPEYFDPNNYCKMRSIVAAAQELIYKIDSLDSYLQSNQSHYPKYYNGRNFETNFLRPYVKQINNMINGY